MTVEELKELEISDNRLQYNLTQLNVYGVGQKEWSLYKNVPEPRDRYEIEEELERLADEIADLVEKGKAKSERTKTLMRKAERLEKEKEGCYYER